MCIFRIFNIGQNPAQTLPIDPRPWYLKLGSTNYNLLLLLSARRIIIVGPFSVTASEDKAQLAK